MRSGECFNGCGFVCNRLRGLVQSRAWDAVGNGGPPGLNAAGDHRRAVSSADAAQRHEGL